MLAWVLMGTSASIWLEPVTFTLALPPVNWRALMVGIGLACPFNGHREAPRLVYPVHEMSGNTAPEPSGMRKANLLVKRYGSGRAVFMAVVDVRYAAKAEKALARSTRITPSVDEEFLAALFAEAGIPLEVMAELLATLQIDDEVFMAHQHGWP